MKKVVNKSGENFILRRLTPNDTEALGKYFNDLSELTRKNFGPHPLTQSYATFLCHRHLEKAIRFVLVDYEGNIQGYFIVDFGLVEYEADRYAGYRILVEEGKDVFFAPSISDRFQNTGIASQVMPHLLNLLKEDQVRSIILLGGVRETNPMAVRFYEKFGFNKMGGYMSDVYNIDMHLVLKSQ